MVEFYCSRILVDSIARTLHVKLSVAQRDTRPSILLLHQFHLETQNSCADPSTRPHRPLITISSGDHPQTSHTLPSKLASRKLRTAVQTRTNSRLRHRGGRPGARARASSFVRNVSQQLYIYIVANTLLLIQSGISPKHYSLTHSPYTRRHLLHPAFIHSFVCYYSPSFGTQNLND